MLHRTALGRLVLQPCPLSERKHLLSVAVAQAKGARRLRRFRSGQRWVSAECLSRGNVRTLKRPEGRAPAALRIGALYEYKVAGITADDSCRSTPVLQTTRSDLPTSRLTVHRLPSREFVFSGVRPSSGAETLENDGT